MLGDNFTPTEQYYRTRYYPAGGLYSTVNDLSHFLIAHMNEGIYNGTQILKKDTIELMHEIQNGNQIGYGLAWMHVSINGISLSGHGGDLFGIDTWMLYNQTQDFGVIYFANGNPVYSALPYKGGYVLLWIFDLLFSKVGDLIEEM